MFRKDGVPSNPIVVDLRISNYGLKRRGEGQLLYSGRSIKCLHNSSGRGVPCSQLRSADAQDEVAPGPNCSTRP